MKMVDGIQKTVYKKIDTLNFLITKPVFSALFLHCKKFPFVLGKKAPHTAPCVSSYVNSSIYNRARSQFEILPWKMTKTNQISHSFSYNKLQGYF